MNPIAKEFVVNRIGRTFLLSLILAGPFVCVAAETHAAKKTGVDFPFKAGDRVAWIGSSSTAIGRYCVTMEFLLRTRHPELNLTFARYGDPSNGTFATCLVGLSKWLPEFKPTVVFFQYGGNDTRQGEAGLPSMRSNMEACVNKAKEFGARVLVITPQAVDEKKEPDMSKIFRTYAENMLAFGGEKNWDMVDTHHPLDRFYHAVQKDTPAFVFTEYHSHLCPQGYLAWGFYQYELLNAPAAESAVELSAAGKIISTTHCSVENATVQNGGISFVRCDEILPILPAKDLPPRECVPMEKLSRYVLKIAGLADSKYSIFCEGKPIGSCDAKALAAGVNLNSLLLDSKNAAPWADLANELYMGCAHKLGLSSTDQHSALFAKIGKTRWQFDVKRE